MLSPIGASIAGLALALGGTSAAAFTGALPAPAQDFAHRVIGAPAATATQLRTHTGTPTGDPSSAGTPVGPDASGPAMFGLCTAWTAHQAHGETANGNADDAVAFKNLAAAAGGADKIGAYCATILRSPSPTIPGAPTTERAQTATGHPTGKPTTMPTTMPTQASTSHPTGKPTTMPTQASTNHPTGKPITLTPRP